MQHLQGMPDASYCTVFLELDGGALVGLREESVDLETAEEELVPLKSNEHNFEVPLVDVVGKKVVRVATDQLGELYVVVEGAVALQFSVCNGSGLSARSVASVLEDEVEPGVTVLLTDSSS